MMVILTTNINDFAFKPQNRISKFKMFLLQYWHNWESGDFIISDNLAVGHEASPQSQFERSKVGLRVMHRVTVAGKSKPKKTTLAADTCSSMP